MSKTCLYFKIILLGSGSVGKSALVARFVNNQFVPRYEPTIEETFSKTIKIDENPILLDIYDTAGTEQFRTMQDLYMKEGDGFILVFSIVSQATFNELISIYNHIIEVKNSMPKAIYKITIAGNKCDLESDRCVKTEEGQELAERYNCEYIETSAKTQYNVNEMFEQLTRRLMENTKQNKSNRCSIL